MKDSTTPNPTAEFAARGALTTLQSVDDKVSALLARPRTMRQQMTQTDASCAEMSDDLNHKMNQIYERLMELEDERVFDQHQQTQHHEVISSSPEAGHLDRQVMRLYRRLSAPFKKAGRRLREMESVRDDFEATAKNLEAVVMSSNEEVDRRFGEFFNYTLEAFDHQHHQLEKYSKKLAELGQCCGGVGKEVEALVAKFNARSENGSVAAGGNSGCNNGSVAALQRIREQMRFDANRILMAVNEQGKNVAFACSKVESGTAEGTASTASTTTTATTTTTTATTTTARSAQIIYKEELRTNNAKFSHHVGGEDDRDSPKGCEDLLDLGADESRVYVVDLEEGEGDLNAKERSSFRRRLCEQRAAGGGWTVKMSNFVLVVVGLTIIRLI